MLRNDLFQSADIILSDKSYFQRKQTIFTLLRCLLRKCKQAPLSENCHLSLCPYSSFIFVNDTIPEFLYLFSLRINTHQAYIWMQKTTCTIWGNFQNKGFGGRRLKKSNTLLACNGSRQSRLFYRWPYCRRYFQIHFLRPKLFCFGSNFPEICLINKNSALVPIVVCRRTGNKP